MPVVIIPNDFTVKKLSIEALSESSRKQEKTMKMCHIEHNGSNLLVQTPQIDLGPYGVNFYENTKTIRLPVENVGDDFKKMIDKLEKYCQNNVESIVNGTFEEGKPDEFEYKSFAKTSDNDKFPSYYKVAVGYADTLYPSVFRKDEDVQHDLRRAMACEITAVNDDLDDATIAFIEKHASILDEEDPFLCFIDELDDHRAIFRSMDQLSRLSFTSTMIPEFGKLLGIWWPLRSASRRPSCFSASQARYCIASIDGDPVPARPVASVNPSTASPQSGLCPKSPSTVKQPPGKVTAHCIDPSAAPLQLGGGTSRPPQGLLATPKGASLCPTDLGLKGSGAARVPAGPDGPRRRDFGWWIRQQHAPMFVFRTSTRWYMGTRMPNAQEVPM
ncbi:hypothetical protein PAPYR_11640 [Paratrimastix pyriformis]|uniref:Uncharacterized protein n=1 Tax=Paratrimastix pyriformis TaxID=342808 RepID=A0ABQ8U3D7_9EUKA|nr:hypothetical protein PAPYR_11640 [Paratrimastix pyriformis]